MCGGPHLGRETIGFPFLSFSQGRARQQLRILGVISPMFVASGSRWFPWQESSPLWMVEMSFSDGPFSEGPWQLSASSSTAELIVSLRKRKMLIIPLLCKFGVVLDEGFARSIQIHQARPWFFLYWRLNDAYFLGLLCGLNTCKYSGFPHSGV